VDVEHAEWLADQHAGRRGQLEPDKSFFDGAYLAAIEQPDFRAAELGHAGNRRGSRWISIQHGRQFAPEAALMARKLKIPVAAQIRGLKKALGNRRTPKAFRPALEKRLRSLQAR
jgi:hypothetical protein